MRRAFNLLLDILQQLGSSQLDAALLDTCMKAVTANRATNIGAQQASQRLSVAAPASCDGRHLSKQAVQVADFCIGACARQGIQLPVSLLLWRCHAAPLRVLAEHSAADMQRTLAAACAAYPHKQEPDFLAALDQKARLPQHLAHASSSSHAASVLQLAAEDTAKLSNYMRLLELAASLFQQHSYSPEASRSNLQQGLVDAVATGDYQACLRS